MAVDVEHFDGPHDTAHDTAHDDCNIAKWICNNWKRLFCKE